MKFQFLALFCVIFDPGNVKKPSKKMGSPLSLERIVVGGFKDLLFSPLFGKDSDFDSNGLKAPTRFAFFKNWELNLLLGNRQTIISSSSLRNWSPCVRDSELNRTTIIQHGRRRERKVAGSIHTYTHQLAKALANNDWMDGIHGCFRKWWYPRIIHFNRDFPYKPSILRYPYFWKHPHGCALKTCSRRCAVKRSPKNLRHLISHLKLEIKAGAVW